MVGEILNQGGEELQNPSTPQLSTTTTIFLKTIKERRIVLQVLLYNPSFTD